jgi:hypothetical protein
MSPQDHGIVITVSSRHVVICRRRRLDNGSIFYECARNADELEADAMFAVAMAGHPFMTGQEISCPPELAVRAQWS